MRGRGGSGPGRSIGTDMGHVHGHRHVVGGVGGGNGGVGGFVVVLGDGGDDDKVVMVVDVVVGVVFAVGCHDSGELSEASNANMGRDQVQKPRPVLPTATAEAMTRCCLKTHTGTARAAC